jgi:uncharacterized protein
VNTSHSTPLSSRVLLLNVGFLLSTGPGNLKDIPFDVNEPVRIAEDLMANSITGTLRLSRTKEGILLEADLDIAVDCECARCLDSFEQSINVQIQELFAHPRPIAETEFFVGADAKLDLAPILRAETLIELSHRQYCREDCKGLCPVCGINRNYETCHCDELPIDPRLAKLKHLLDAEE